MALMTFNSDKFSLTAELNIIRIKKNPKHMIKNPIIPINTFNPKTPSDTPSTNSYKSYIST